MAECIRSSQPLKIFCTSVCYSLWSTASFQYQSSFYLLAHLQKRQAQHLLRTSREFLVISHPLHASYLTRGLLADDSEWRFCLEEASLIQTGTALRHLFAMILLFGDPSDPGALWAEFRSHICDDLEYRLHAMGIQQTTSERMYDYGLFLLEKILGSHWQNGHQ